MRDLSSVRNVIHGSTFFLVAGTKTLCNIGSTCLTVDATFAAFFCLTHYHHQDAKPDHQARHFNISWQVISAFFSTVIMMLSRYPHIWNNLTADELVKLYDQLKGELKTCGQFRKSLLVVLGFLGFLSCVARGISAYLGTIVILSERFHSHSKIVKPIAWLSAITVATSSICFNLSKMLLNTAKYLKSPSLPAFSKIFFGALIVFTNAGMMRFFIKEFLDRQDASLMGQIIGQSIFFTAALVMSLFTLGASFEEGWYASAKKTLKKSYFFSVLSAGDFVTTWLGYSTIALYAILTDFFIEKNVKKTHDGYYCSKNNDIAGRWALMTLSVMVGWLVALSWSNYVLSDAKKGYDLGLFNREHSSDEEQSLLNGGSLNTTAAAYF